MGPRARKAIEAYQAKHGLAVNGRASRDLLQHLQRQSGVGRQQAAPETADTRSPDVKFEDTLPELGPVRASVRLSRSKGAYRLDDLRLTLGTKDVLWVEASGTLGILRPGRDAPLEGLALTVRAALPSSKTLPQVFPPDLPELRKLRARFDVRGSLEALSIAGARIEAEGPNGLTGTASGRIARLSLLPVLAIKDLAFDLEAQSPSTKSIFQLFGLSLPELGPVRARAILKDRGDLFALTAIDVSAGSADRPAAHATGQIGDLLAMKKIELSGDFQIATAKLLDPDAPVKKSALGRVHGRFRLSDADGSIGIEALSAEVENTKLLSLSAKGLFDDIRNKDELRFEAVLKVPDVSELAGELGFKANLKGSLSFMGQVSGSGERLQAEGKARLGETDLSGTLSVSLVGERPELRAILNSPAFHLADFGLLPDSDTPESTAKKEGKDNKPVREWVFGETPISFGALKDFNLDFDMQLEKVVGVQLKIDKVEARLDIVDGLLKVDPLRLDFVGGHIEMRLIADARTKVPEVSLNINADDVDLGDFLAQVETAVPLDGELDMSVHLKAAGLSPRALAASLEGELDVAVAQGHVRTGLLDLAVTNPVGWLFSESARKGYADLNCLVARFDLQKGVAKSVTLLLDTPNVRAGGSGAIDFGDEIMNFDVNPSAKRRRLIAITTPFKIEGPLASPSVNVSTVGATTGMVGKVLASPINFLGSLLPFGSDRGKDPCFHLQDRKRRPKAGNKSN
jgi:peptidoglycan hydrolase-like protein with peptidoglycan-binding domain